MSESRLFTHSDKVPNDSKSILRLVFGVVERLIEEDYNECWGRYKEIESRIIKRLIDCGYDEYLKKYNKILSRILAVQNSCKRNMQEVVPHILPYSPKKF